MPVIDVQGLCKRFGVVILDRGRLVAQSTLADLTSGGRLEEVFLRLTSEPSAAN